MEMILIPLILGTLLLGLRGNYLAAMVVLGLAVGTKFWPLLLAPILLRPLLGDPRRLVPALLVLAGLSGLMLMPFYLSGLDSQAGFTAYGKSWQMNDSAFMLILWLMEWILTTMGWGLGWAQPLARMAVGSILFTWLLWLLREEAEDEKAVVRRCLMATAALFLLSPTQFPWYALWMLPFLALCPRISLLLLSALLPIYYLRFYFSARAQAPIFDHGIVWLQYVPVWGLLAWEWHRGPKVHEAPVETRGDSGHGL